MKYKIEIESPERSGIFRVKYIVSGKEVSERELKERDAFDIFCILDTATEVLRKHKGIRKI